MVSRKTEEKLRKLLTPSAATRECLERLLDAMGSHLEAQGWERAAKPHTAGRNRIHEWRRLAGWCTWATKIAFKYDLPDFLTVSLVVHAPHDDEELLVDAADLEYLCGRRAGYRLPVSFAALRCGGLIRKLLRDLDRASPEFFSRYDSLERAQEEIRSGRTIHGPSRNRWVKLLLAADPREGLP